MWNTLQKYTGRTVEIIYLGRDNRITQRRIEIRLVEDGMVKAYCLERRAPRTFQASRILAVQPVGRKTA
ncbi:WYL domain-containing protein [Paenibacillus sp. P26]|nr:WYL domain-containing protein [Paenibacillus sp. P26]UUZ95220.1 WYL domain-containing protein [Paenibacillus sp. P25]